MLEFVHGTLVGRGDDTVPAIGIPNAPVVAEHQERAFEAVFVVSLVFKAFAESSHRGVHGRVLWRHGLLDLEEEAEISGALFREQVGAGGDFSGVGTDDFSVGNSPVFGIAIPTVERFTVEQVDRSFALGKTGEECCKGLVGMPGKGEEEAEEGN